LDHGKLVADLGRLGLSADAIAEYTVVSGALGARMPEPIGVSRRLVAVFAADVEGYSRLMGADEVGALKGLTERRAILDELIGGQGAA
jgi:class 3 adenylate cyclase